MKDQNPSFFPPLWLDEASGDFEQFCRLTRRETRASDAPMAVDIQQNIPVYDGHFCECFG